MFLKQILIIASLLWALAECRVGSSERSLQENAERQVVYLLQFDIRLALDGTKSPDNVNIYTLRQIVTSWMDDSYKAKSENDSLLSYGASFDYVALDFVTRRQLEETTGGDARPTTFYKATFRGFSVWNLESFGTEPVNSDFVELIQKATLLEDKRLLELLRGADDGMGLGATVLDVRAELANAGSDDAGDTDSDSETDETLEIIIVIAIVVACMAFCLLMFAVIWAWRTDRAKREAYRASHREQGHNVIEKTRREPPPPQYKNSHPPKVVPPSNPPPAAAKSPPLEIPASSNYPDSVISDSVITDSVVSNGLETSYTGYSMPHQAASATAPSAKFEPRELNDAASMSSMDSYGYSLDGYASSLGGPPKFPGGALSMPSESNAPDASDADLAPSINGDSYKK